MNGSDIKILNGLIMPLTIALFGLMGLIIMLVRFHIKRNGKQRNIQ